MRTILKSDYINGTKLNISKFIIGFLFSIGCCLAMNQSVDLSIHKGEISELPGLENYFLFVFGGIIKYVENPDIPFQVPFLWLSTQLLIEPSRCATACQDAWLWRSFFLQLKEVATKS